MRTLGLLGGMSWESTAIYYRHLNEITRERLGGLASAALLLESFNFAVIAHHQHTGDWDAAKALLVQAAQRLQRAGAECLVVCTNTMHRLADDVQAAIDIPLLHIADATAARLLCASVRRPLLLATKFTMEQDFYRSRLKGKFGVDCVVPDQAGRDQVHRIIYEELCRGVVLPESKQLYLHEINKARARGADGVIFGCTEINMLLSSFDTDLPTFDSTRIHAEEAVDFSLGAPALSAESP
jgi:aspartate racemase